MGIIIKTDDEIANIREGGKRLARILIELKKSAVPGVSAYELDRKAREMISELGDTPSFLNYRPDGASKAYPAALCVSVNSEIVHGIPGKNKILKEGDLVGLDLGLCHKNTYVDAALSLSVGRTDKKTGDFLNTAENALMAGIEAVRVGNTIGDIGATIGDFARKAGYGIVRELAGHGVGRKVHEPPYIPNYGKRGTGEKIKAGMVLALEPMFTEGTGEIITLSDGHTFATADGSRAVHFEHTVIVTENGPEIATQI